nr:hypothetical protein [Phycisphaerae bacterium]NIW96170.1 hypothetical protein [Phycisphaerae bacterium]
MKKLLFVFLVAFVLCSTAMAADLALYDGPPNPDWYTVAAMNADVATIIAQAGHLFGDVQTFDGTQLAAFGTWIDDNTNDGELDVIWLNGTIPSVLYANPNVNPDGSRAETWLDNGNMIINVGDWFAYCTYETGVRGADNGPSGAGNILDLANGIIVSNQSFVMQITAAGTTYLPSLNSVNIIRPTVLSQVVAPWEVAEIFAQNAAGTLADPVVLHNTVTDGYVCFINQSNNANTIADRGLTSAEFLINWADEHIGFDTTKARNPDPKNGATDVPVDANLAWMRGDGAVQDDVYFGTDPCALPKVTTIMNLPPFPPKWDPPGDLVASTTYYWRIDEVNGPTIVTGDLWSFTTIPGEAGCSYPYDGAIISGDMIEYPANSNIWYIWTKLTFIPGATASNHTGYFNEDYSKVESRAQDANLGHPPYASVPGWEYTFFAGNPQVPPADETLVRGTRYYWTVDAEDAMGNVFGGEIWEFAIQGFYAFSPKPPNEAILISTEPFLSWLPGFGVDEHDIYMGTSWEDVNNAVYDYMAPPPEFVATRLDPNYQVVTSLPGDTKIYWRVDEVQGRIPPFFIPTALYKGNVWCFTTIPVFDITDPNRVGWWTFDIGMGTTAFDESGHERHGTLMGDPQWVTGGMFGGAMDFDGTGDYINIDGYKGIVAVGGVQQPFTIANWFRTTGNAEMVTWGTNSGRQRLSWRVDGGRLRTEHGSGNLRGNTYVNDGEWHHGALVVTEGASLREPNTLLYVDGERDTTFSGSDNTYNLTPGADVSIGRRATHNDRYFNGQIDDVQIFDYALSDGQIKMLGAPPEAWDPSPYDGQAGVPVTVPLQWMPGKYAAQHDVYFGSDYDTVNNATTSTPGIYKGRIGPNTLTVPLVEAELYYWRVDEVNLAGPDPYIWKGSTWMFRTVGAAGGLRGDYYEHTGAASPAGFEIYKLTRIDPTVDFGWGTGPPDPNVTINDFSVRWSGHVEPLISGDWMFWT